MAKLAAGVKKRDNGLLEKRFYIDGKRYSVYGRTNKELTQKEQDLREKIKDGFYKKNSDITFGEYFNEWKEQKRTGIRESTLKQYISQYDSCLKGYFENIKIISIERRQILKWQAEMQKSITRCGKEYSISTLNFTLTLLKSVLKDAVNDEIIVKSPAAGVKALKNTKIKATETYHRALTVEEQKEFMKALESEYYYEFIAFLLCSGMRIGELGALSWKDIDRKNGVIHITKTITRTLEDGMVVGDFPKTDAGKRDIPLTENLKKILAREKEKQELISNIANIDGQIFTTSRGGIVGDQEVNRTIKKVLRRLESMDIHIEHFTAHALRDTYATRFIEQKGSMQTLKTLLGHTSLAMTMDLYAHVLPDTKKDETEKIVFDIAL